MVLVLTFGVLLLVTILLSGLAKRSFFSLSVLFLAAGFVLGPEILGWINPKPDDPTVIVFIEIALVTVLFTDGMHIGFRDLLSAWGLPSRALFLGMPLTILAIASLARFLVGIGWTESFLVAAVLGPTDPVFASAIVGRDDVPKRLRHLLNVESGLNDGLALPAVLALLAALGPERQHLGIWLLEIGLGLALGTGIAWVICRLAKTRLFSPAPEFQQLFALCIGLLLFSIGSLTHANLFLAAYTGGITVATVAPEIKDAFIRFGELTTELMKLTALVVFGALISVEIFGRVGIEAYVFAILALVLARPVSLGLALLGTPLSKREKLAAAWFGPRGFASVIYGLFALRSGIPHAALLFHLAALVIIGSILAHSSTDVLVARWFQKSEDAESGI